jgi:hypothetical protein
MLTIFRLAGDCCGAADNVTIVSGFWQEKRQFDVPSQALPKSHTASAADLPQNLPHSALPVARSFLRWTD